MCWIYNETEIISLSDLKESYIGFVYMITNKLNNRMYVGKKQFYYTKTSQKTVTLKNGTKKKKKVKIMIESDWASYFGSNTELQEDVKKHGVENFRREILKMCYTLGEMSYWETYEIFVRHAVPSPEYYNVWVSVRVRSNHLPKTFMEKIK